MSKKYVKVEAVHSIDFRTLLKHNLIEDLKWFEEEINKLYLYKDDYNADEIHQGKIIIDIINHILELSYDRQLKYLIDNTLKSIKKKYPEFF